jgi:hypothetical protein
VNAGKLSLVVLSVSLGGCSSSPQDQGAAATGAGGAPVPILRVVEVHFDPSLQQGKSEFIEIANVGRADADVSGWAVTGAGRVVLPAGIVLPPGGTFILCEDRAACEALAGDKLETVVVYPGKLKAKGETIRIEDATGKVLDEAGYHDKDPEVEKAAGTGLSLHRSRLRASATQGLWTSGKPTPGKYPVRSGERATAGAETKSAPKAASKSAPKASTKKSVPAGS